MKTSLNYPIAYGLPNLRSSTHSKNMDIFWCGLLQKCMCPIPAILNTCIACSWDSKNKQHGFCMLCTYQCQAHGGGVRPRVGILTFSKKTSKSPPQKIIVKSIKIPYPWTREGSYVLFRPCWKQQESNKEHQILYESCAIYNLSDKNLWQSIWYNQA